MNSIICRKHVIVNLCDGCEFYEGFQLDFLNSQHRNILQAPFFHREYNFIELISVSKKGSMLHML